MSTNPNIPLIEVPIGGNGGLVWNRLHAEREDICEAILKQSQTSDGEAVNVDSDQLQDRLRRIDEALDRLMSGTYGECRKCGRWIEDTKLYFDPALAFCLDCQANDKGRTTRLLAGKARRQEANKSVESSASDIALESLEEFDTVLVQTVNSDYRLFAA
jgi:hypothetical protein